MIGVYYLTEQSIADLNGDSLKRTKLELKGEHQYLLTDGPSEIMNEHSKNGTFIKAGRWYTDCAESYGCMIELEGICVVTLCKKDDKISIPISIGDPDQCEGVVFEKSKQERHSYSQASLKRGGLTEAKPKSSHLFTR